MEILDEYSCWLDGQSEDDAKIIKSDSVREAAKMAVDSWRHEGALDVFLSVLNVNVKDSDGLVHRVGVAQDRYLDETGPEA